MTQYLVFDVGGTNLKYALMNKSGHIIVKNKIPTPKENLDNFLSSVYKICEAYRNKFDGIAVSAPGKIDVKSKTIYYGAPYHF